LPSISSTDVLYHELASFGEIFPLNFSVDLFKLKGHLESLQDEAWAPYNRRKSIARWGLSLLKGEDSENLDLDSLRELNFDREHPLTEKDFRQFSKYFQLFRDTSEVFEVFKDDLVRSHIIRLDSGGFFPPHRDAYGPGRGTFRLFAPLLNCGPAQFKFILNQKVLPLEPGRVYFINTRLEHSVFSFVDNSLQLVLNLELSVDSVKKVLSNLLDQ
jgi:hypothetical protein